MLLNMMRTLPTDCNIGCGKFEGGPVGIGMINALILAADCCGLYYHFSLQL
jgi:hypothetical protein